MDSSHVENSPQPSVSLPQPLDCPPGWPPCERKDVEGIRAYNTFVNAWTTWASADPNEDGDKWGEALKYVNLDAKGHLVDDIIKGAREELGGKRYEKVC
ncbi:hypothetical protein FMUND_11620 [Fusarium mundagurra]|uniref:Uncharacterized protein n=1 Tax=Fusarium mundagurra TaxID=1567541 RepID=A0A8H6D735_9HYPO|nr:hypothetical protein FMUND_11620 [Fusarium mundagurra]